MNAKIDPSELDIRAEARKLIGIRQGYAARVEEIVFRAYYNGEDVGHVTVDRWVKLTEEESNDAFYVDNRFEPPKPIPWTFYVGVKEGMRLRGIATSMLLFANDYYQKNHGISLHTPTEVPTPSADNGYFGSRPVFEALARDSLAEEICCKGKTRWRLL